MASSAGPDSEVDPNTGLTATQKTIIQDTWALVYKDSTDNGVAVLMTFFKTYPSYQQYFKSFKNVPLDELPGNERFRSHAQNIMLHLNLVVEAINDPSTLVNTLKALGERHRNRGQTSEQFLQLKAVILDVLKMKFGAAFTAEVEEAWTKTLDAIFAVVLTVFSS